MLTYLGDFENPGQLPVQGVLEGTDDCIWWIFEISSVFMFSRSRHPFLIFLLSYHVRVTSKIQVNFRYRRYSKVLNIASSEFWNSFNVYVFEVNKSISDIPKQLPCSSDLKNPDQLLVSKVLRGADNCALQNFIRRRRNLSLTFQLSYLVWVISKTSRTGHWPRFRGRPNKVSQ